MKTKNGQVALIALLVLAVATTVGLAFIARGTTNVATTRNTEESARAFSAAEAGIEEALRPGGFVGNSSEKNYTTTLATVTPGVDAPYVFPNKIAKGDTETVWLAPHDENGKLIDSAPYYKKPNIDVCWSSATPAPALVVTLLYKGADGQYRSAKNVYDPDTSRATTNKFTALTTSEKSGGCGDGTTTYKKSVLFTDLAAGINPAVSTLLMLRLRPVYADTQIAVIPADILPDQYTRIESIGRTASGVTRKISVTKKYIAPASIFDAAVYSQGSFAQ